MQGGIRVSRSRCGRHGDVLRTRVRKLQPQWGTVRGSRIECVYSESGRADRTTHAVKTKKENIKVEVKGLKKVTKLGKKEQGEEQKKGDRDLRLILTPSVYSKECVTP